MSITINTHRTGRSLVSADLFQRLTSRIDTHEYAAFSDRVAGRFLHHVPTNGRNDGESPAAVFARTTTAMRRLGFCLDEALWPRTALGGCTGCHNGCHEDPPPVAA